MKEFISNHKNKSRYANESSERGAMIDFFDCW